MKTMSKWLLIAVLATVSLMQTACTDEEAALGAGFLIGVIVGDHGHHHHHTPPPRYRRGFRGPGYSMVSASLEKSELQIAAEHLGLSEEQAAVVMSALEDASQKDFSAIQALGLKLEDLQQMANGSNPSVSALKGLADALSIDLAQAHELIQILKSDLEIALKQ